jgi:hypothetical protein
LHHFAQANACGGGNRLGPLNLTQNLEVHLVISLMQPNEPIEKVDFLVTASSA